MNGKIFALKGNFKEFSIFIQSCHDDGSDIIGIAMQSRWQPLTSYTPTLLEIHMSDSGKKKYKFDFSGFLGPFLVFSEQAIDKLGDILLPKGQVLPVITESKKKKFFGYYPTNPLKGCFDKEKSIYREYPKGLMIDKPVLIEKNITDEYLFSIEEDISRVFVTDKFKTRVEESGLLGFDFSVEIQTT